jgi:RNA polymerase sigma-70 factor (ECF subfamily)
MKLVKSSYYSKDDTKTDSELIACYQETNDTRYVGELYNRYHHLVFGVALKYLHNTDQAEDALLEIFKRLFEQLLKYNIDDFKHWLLTVTRNYCLKYLKASAQTVNFDTIHENQFRVDFMESEQQMDLLYENEEKIELLKLALEQLKPEQKQCVSMFYIDDKSYQTISLETGFDIKKVKSYIQNGKRNLQLMMEQNKK